MDLTVVIYCCCTGEKLIPDFFLDEAENFQAEWLQDGSPAQHREQAQPAPSNTPQGIFTRVESLLSPEIVKQVGATYLFIVDGAHPGNWVLDLKNGPGSVTTTESEIEANVTMKMDSGNLVAMFKGELSPTTAFMTGKLKISGNLAKAMMLEKLLGKMKSKL